MNGRRIELLVLDAQGVVLNAPLLDFLDELADRTGQSTAGIKRKWRQELRLPAWTGAISDEELWRELAPGAGPDLDPSGLLERRFAPGPAAAHLVRWSRRVSIWLLSNHRTHWLVPRLERFGLIGSFEKILISDELGAAKPDPAVFEPALRAVRRPSTALFVDDMLHNVQAARGLGMTAIHAHPSIDWIAEIDSLLETGPAGG